MADFGIAEGIALAGVVAGAGTAVYSAQENAKAIKANKPVLPVVPKVADESLLSDQRKKRLMSAAGRDGTILAPVGINGSPLGGPSSTAGAVPAKTTLGA